MNTLLTVFSNGLANGAIYALLALALVTVFRTTGHLNFAQGELAALSAFLVLTGIRLGLNVWVAVVISIIITGLVIFFGGNGRSQINNGIQDVINTIFSKKQ